MNQADENIMRGVHASFAIHWGTNAPFAMGSVYFRKIGFADIPIAGIGIVSSASAGSMVPIARQAIFHELESCGVSNEVIQFTPTCSTGRRQKFLDINSSSETLGKNKMGVVYDFHFEIKKEFLFLFEFDWRTGKIKSSGIKE